MNRRTALNVALLALVGALALFAYLEPGIEAPPAPPRLTSLDPARIGRIEIERPGGGAAIRLRREAAGWWLEAPVRVAANEFRVQALLGIVEARTHARFEADAAELGEYRLDPPLGVLRLDDLELRLGDTEPLNHRRYVMLGRYVHLIDDRYDYRPSWELTDLVSPRLLPPGARPVEIRLPGFTVARGEAGGWTVIPAPGGAPPGEAGMDALNAFVDAWREARAVEIDRYRGEAARERVQIRLEGEAAPLEFGILAREPELVLGRADLGLRYHLTSEQGGRLLRLRQETQEKEEGQ